MRRLLLLFILYIEYRILPSSKTMNGKIWSKTQQTFIPISSVPIYAKLQQERFEKSKALESHNFQLQNLTLTAFEEPHFLNFHHNGTKISGLYGELWNLLSESLNFTLQSVKTNVDGLGVSQNLSYKHSYGLLGMISRNETIVIPKLELYSLRLEACDFTVPFWINRYYLYIPMKVMYDNKWMVKIFSWRIWVVILMMHVLLSVCAFLAQSILVRAYATKYNSRSFGEHLFYSYRNLCNQNIIPEYSNGRSRILEISSGLFSTIIFMAYGALLFTYLAKNVIIFPFNNFDSMTYDTNYKVITVKGSIGDITFQVNPLPSVTQIKISKRLVKALTVEETYKKACFSRKEKYVVFQTEDEYKVRGHDICYLTSAGKFDSNVWMGSGIIKNFKYKRTMDIGIIKLMETGLMNALRNRWFKQKEQNFNNNAPKPIEMQQVFLIIIMALSGVMIALIIFVIENIVFVYKIKQ